MYFHSKQSKVATEGENKFKSKIYNIPQSKNLLFLTR